MTGLSLVEDPRRRTTGPIFDFDAWIPMMVATSGIGEIADKVADALPTLIDGIKRIGGAA